MNRMRLECTIKFDLMALKILFNLKDSYSTSLKKILVCVVLLRRVVWVVDLGVEYLLRQVSVVI